MSKIKSLSTELNDIYNLDQKQAWDYLYSSVGQLFDVFYEQRKKYPKYQLFESKTLDNKEVLQAKPIVFVEGNMQYMIPETKEDLIEISNLCAKHIISQTWYNSCEKIVIYNPINHIIVSFRIVLSDDSWSWSKLIYSFCHPNHKFSIFAKYN